MQKPIVNGIEISGFLPPFIRPLRDAIREDRKTQTRRVVKPQPIGSIIQGNSLGRKWVTGMKDEIITKCPYGFPGQIRALREPIESSMDGNSMGHAYYADDGEPVMINDGGLHLPWQWKVKTLSQLYMPYEAARTFVKIKNIHVERLQDITYRDMIAEGIKGICNRDLHLGWVKLWDSINAKRGYAWDTNCWVWKIEFERIKNA